MKKMLLTGAALLSLVGAYAQQSFKDAVKQGHENVLGSEPYQFLEDGTWHTSNGDVGFDLMYGNGQHAYFRIPNEYFQFNKTAVLTTFDPFTENEKAIINANQGYGLQVDTINKQIINIDNEILDGVWDFPHTLRGIIEGITNEIVEEDIIVNPVGTLENKFKNNIYLKGDEVIINSNGSYNILISDINGRIVSQEKGFDETRIDLSKMSNGVYNFIIFNETNKDSKRIIYNR